jgi:hypothetical protein
MSILFCVNATGSHKLRPLVIGKSLNPQCFKNLNKSTLSVTYRANSKAWMRSDIFVEWIKDLDYYFRIIERKILLLVNNAGSHFNPKILKRIILLKMNLMMRKDLIMKIKERKKK